MHTTESKTLYRQSWLHPVRDRGWSGIGNYNLLSVLLLEIMAALYYLFR